MGTVLGDLRQATIDYLKNNVTIDISPPFKLQPDLDQFEFNVTFKNTAMEAGGIALKNVRYQVQLDPGNYPPPVPLLITPSGGSSIDHHGVHIPIGFSTAYFDYQPSDENLAYLQIGESQVITFQGTAHRSDNGVFSLFVGIQADPDLNSIFPQNYTSLKVKRNAGFPM